MSFTNPSVKVAATLTFSLSRSVGIAASYVHNSWLQNSGEFMRKYVSSWWRWDARPIHQVTFYQFLALCVQFVNRNEQRRQLNESEMKWTKKKSTTMKMKVEADGEAARDDFFCGRALNISIKVFQSMIDCAINCESWPHLSVNVSTANAHIHCASGHTGRKSIGIWMEIRFLQSLVGRWTN